MSNSRQTFVDYISKLAPEGETALLVQQHPITRHGQAILCSDGSPRYTWPAYLPTHRMRHDGAWYLNTGSFIQDRLKDGHPSASAANCEHVLCLMLDDIGTKSKKPPLPPSWVMETSEGSFQWGYTFSEQPTKAEFTAAMRAIAKAGFTDPGALNAVRNFRIPGSINLKPNRNNFAAVLTEFNPNREFTLPEICAALGVVPELADETKPYAAVKLIDTGVDVVFKWLNEHNLVLSAPNKEGWAAVVCPNHENHSTGNVEARYMPATRSFCCYHGHCEHLTSDEFLRWIGQNGGPATDQGIRADIISDQLGSVVGQLQQASMFKTSSDTIIEEVEARTAARVERSKWYKRFAYIISGDCYFDVETRNEISRQSFNAIFRHIDCRSVHDNKRHVEASICFDENRAAMKARALDNLTYAAGEDVFLTWGGKTFANRWINARPDVSDVTKATADDVAVWLDHARTLVPVEEELEHILDVMAYKVQNPSVKINHAVLHGGDEGCGKDTMWAPFLWAVCGPRLQNRGLIDNDSMSSQWGYQFESEVLILNELREPDARERRALANKLKPVIAAPPETLPVNRKNLHPYDMLNRMFVLAFSNDLVPISLASTDRRWFCVWSHAPRMAAAEAKRIWDWYTKGGFAKVAKFLHLRDVSAFNPAAAPPMTDFKQSLVEHGMTSMEATLVDYIRERKNEFARGIVMGPFNKLCEHLEFRFPNSPRIPQAAILHALREAGWVDCGRVGARGLTNKRHIFAVPALADHNSKTQLREMAENMPSEEGVVVGIDTAKRIRAAT